MTGLQSICLSTALNGFRGVTAAVRLVTGLQSRLGNELLGYSNVVEFIQNLIESERIEKNLKKS